MFFDIDRKPGSAPALREDNGRAVCYGELAEVCPRLGRHLQLGRLAFCLCANKIAAVAGYLAAMESGVPVLLLRADLGGEQLASYFRIYRPDYLWAPSAEEERLTDLCGPCRVTGLITYHEYTLWQMDDRERPCGSGHEAPLHPDLCLLLATSGSTGEAKLVRLTRKNVESNAAAIRNYLQLTERERPITSLPMYYTYGLSVINSHLLAGACILLTDSSYVQQTFWDFLEREQATSLAGVPYTYQILKRIKVFQKTIPSLTTLTQAGGRLPADLQEEVFAWARRQGTDFYIMYGQTEATARMSYLPPDRCGDKPGSIGIAIPGGRLFLLDEKGDEIHAPGKEGELCFEGPGVSMGYAACRDDLARGDDNHGRLATGDMARRDEEGFYYITGRKKRFLKLFGIRVSLDACENILCGRFPEADLACTGRDDCLLICADDREVCRMAPEYLADYLAISPRAFRAKYWEKLPRSESGKIRYEAL